VPPDILAELFDVFPVLKDAAETQGKKEKYSQKKQAIGAGCGLNNQT
jgi:hypothetical protein